MASADFNNVALRNIAPFNADGSFVNTGYVFTVGPNAKQYWTNNLNLNNLTVSTFFLNSTLTVTDVQFLYASLSSGYILNLSTLNTINNSTILTSTLSTTNLTYTTFYGVNGTTSTLTGSSINTVNLGFSTGNGLLLTTNVLNTSSLLVNSTLVTSTLNGVNLTYSTLTGSTQVTSTITASTVFYSTGQGSTLTVALFNGTTVNTRNTFYSTLAGSTIQANTIFYNSTLIGSTLNTTSFTYSTSLGSTITTNTLLWNSTMVGSSITTTAMNYSTLAGSTIQANTIIFQSTITGSTINLTSGNYSTLQGSTITASTINAASLLTISSGNVGIGLTNPTFQLQTADLNTINLSNNYKLNWTTVTTDITAFTAVYNGTIGTSGGNKTFTLANNNIQGSMVFNNTFVPGSTYRLTFTVQMTGSNPYFVLFDNITGSVIGSAKIITSSLQQYVVVFTAPSGQVGISFTSTYVSGPSLLATWSAILLEGLFNQFPGGIGIGTTLPQYSLHVSNGSIQAYNYQQFEWINTQTTNTLGSNPTSSTGGLFKIATLGSTSSSSSRGIVNIRGHLGGWTSSAMMYVDLMVTTGGGWKIYGTVYGPQTAATPFCDIVYAVNANSQYDIYLFINRNQQPNIKICYDLMVSGNSGSNILYDPATTGVTAWSNSYTSITDSADIYCNNQGSVGIGTVASSSVLQVYNSNTYTTAPALSVSDGAADNTGTYGMVNLTRPNAVNDNKSHLAFIKNGQSVFGMGYYPGSSNLSFGLVPSFTTMNTATGLWLNTTGSVGIGSTAPTSRLTVVGNTVQGTTAMETIQTLYRNAGGGQNGMSGGLAIGASSINSSSPGRFDIMVNSGATIGNGYGVIPDAVIATFLGNGNVGIGVTAPTAALQVNGAIFASGDITTATGTLTMASISASGNIAAGSFSTKGSPSTVIAASGNVGINTAASGTNSLQVQGTSYFSGSVTSASTIYASTMSTMNHFSVSGGGTITGGATTNLFTSGPLGINTTTTTVSATSYTCVVNGTTYSSGAITSGAGITCTTLSAGSGAITTSGSITGGAVSGTSLTATSSGAISGGAISGTTLTTSGNAGIGGAGLSTGYNLAVTGTIYASGDITGLSDKRVKNDIEPLTNCLHLLRQITGYSYTRTDYDSGKRHIGLIAQELKEVVPEAVSHDAKSDLYSVNYSCLVAPLIQAVKDLNEKVEEQGQLIQTLSDRLGPA